MNPRRRTRPGVVALCVALTLFPVVPPAVANNGGSGCTKPWKGSGSCHLALRGLPIIVGGNAAVSSGTAEVRVWLAPYGRPDVDLFSCEARGNVSGGRGARCEESINVGTAIDPRFPLEYLTCYVSGVGEGTFSCFAGSGT